MGFPGSCALVRFTISDLDSESSDQFPNSLHG